MSWILPRPSGPYLIACCDILNKLGLDSSLFRIYYPTENFEPDEKNCPEWLGEEHFSGLSKLTGYFSGRISKFLFKGNKIPIYQGGPFVLPQNLTRLPVVIVSHGFGLCKDGYSHISYEIASHGFLVAAMDHRDGSACSSMYMDEEEGGKYVKKYVPIERIKPDFLENKLERYNEVDKRTDDVIKLLNCIQELNNGTLNNLLLPEFDLKVFKDKIDDKNCAIVGHSFGGTTVVASLANEPRFKAGVGLEPWTYGINEKYYTTKIEKPMLFINADDGGLLKKDIGRLRRLDADVTGSSAERKIVTLKGTVHMTQCDLTFFPKNAFIGRMIMMRGRTEPKIANGINLKLMLGFIGKYLNLPFSDEVEKIVSENADLVGMGSRIQLSEQELKEAKFPPQEIKVN